MSIPQYSKVKIASNRFAESDGVMPGTEGYVIEFHHDQTSLAYEVEIMNADGTTRALVVARDCELQVIEGV